MIGWREAHVAEVEGDDNAVILGDTSTPLESTMAEANEGDAEDAEGKDKSVVVETAEGVEIPGGAKAADDSDVVVVVRGINESEATDVVEAVEAKR